MVSSYISPPPLQESSTSEEEQPVKPVKVKKSKHTTDTLLDFDGK